MTGKLSMFFKTSSCCGALMASSFGILLISGCGGDGRPVTVPVSGKIILDGAPVAGASVMFLPENGGRPGLGVTNESGIYHLSSYGEKNDGVPVGQYSVAVTKHGGAAASAPTPAASAELPTDTPVLSNLPYVPEDSSRPEPKIEYLVPAAYENASLSGLKATITAGGTESMNFELSSK